MQPELNQKFLFIGVWLFYNVVLVFAIQKSESVIHIQNPRLFWIPLPFGAPQSTEWSPGAVQSVPTIYLFYTQ